MGPKIVTAAGSGVRLRFTPLPIKGFDGKEGLFVPVRLYVKNGISLWQHEDMREPHGCAVALKYVGAGILREETRSGRNLHLSFLSLLALDENPECNPHGEDLVFMGSESGAMKKAGSLLLLSDMPGIRKYIARRYSNSFPIPISKLIPVPDMALREKMYACSQVSESLGR